jgi:hypothetical protein
MVGTKSKYMANMLSKWSRYMVFHFPKGQSLVFHKTDEDRRYHEIEPKIANREYWARQNPR